MAEEFDIVCDGLDHADNSGESDWLAVLGVCLATLAPAGYLCPACTRLAPLPE